MKIRTLIVDDEPLARRRVESLLKGDSDFEVVGECADGRAAIEAIAAHRPDLVFLDVQMPELDGFAVLEALPSGELPEIVFATAHDQYAVRAFDACAVDYLLKPFKRERFLASLERVKARLARLAGKREKDEGEREVPDLQALASMVRADRDRLVVRTAKGDQSKVVFLRSDEVTWIEASANYVLVHAGPRVHQVREKIGDLERTLPRDKFVRIHRSIIVNLDAVAEVQACGGGEHVVVLRSGEELSLGRSYLEHVTRGRLP
ncbi:MAG TPA: response regulator [Polyangiaceae bacterium]|jgi:two-component system LytT family response regulator